MQTDPNDLRYHYNAASKRRTQANARARLIRWLMAYAVALALAVLFLAA